jgi:hypothetical protein
MTSRLPIKVGFCIAYDWYLLQYSLPLIYKEADLICLSIDKDRISWGGNLYSWDEIGFRTIVKDIDTDNKIKVLEEDYHLPDLQPMQNEVRQRKMIAAFMGEGGWHIQLDTDEFFLDFKGFTNTLQSLSPKRKINVVCPWITLYKQDADGFYYIKPAKFNQIEFIQIATQWPHYEYGRRNGYFNIHSCFGILHLSWARDEKEIWEKLNNWGHKNDFIIQDYFDKWKNLNYMNYKNYKDFHHIQPAIWSQLDFIKAKSIDEMLTISVINKIKLPLRQWKLKLMNYIWITRLRSLLKRNV